MILYMKSKIFARIQGDCFLLKIKIAGIRSASGPCHDRHQEEVDGSEYLFFIFIILVATRLIYRFLATHLALTFLLQLCVVVDDAVLMHILIATGIMLLACPLGNSISDGDDTVTDDILDNILNESPTAMDVWKKPSVSHSPIKLPIMG